MGNAFSIRVPKMVSGRTVRGTAAGPCISGVCRGRCQRCPGTLQDGLRLRGAAADAPTKSGFVSYRPAFQPRGTGLTGGKMDHRRISGRAVPWVVVAGVLLSALLQA